MINVLELLDLLSDLHAESSNGVADCIKAMIPS